MGDFLALLNPKLTLHTIITDPRELLLTQPKLAKNEKLPAFLALRHGEKALLSKPTTGYFYVPHVGWYAPTRHKAVIDLVEQELTDTTIPHGTSAGYAQGCRGVLCRRTAYEHRSKDTKQRHKLPQYAGTDPLLAVLTAYAYSQQNTKPRTSTEEKILKLLHKENLQALYEEQVQ